MTYGLAQDPRYTDLMTATSSLTGHTINRFTHLHQSTEDLVKKVKMQRLLGQKTASCFQRCVGMDAFNAVFSTTFEIDEAHGPRYHENFKRFLIMVQDEDLTVDGAMTDPKGDRSKAPHQQADPDMFLHVVERRKDGIVVCGAKCHQTGSVNSHWHIFMPTIAMGPEDKDWAVSFACPTDAEGMFTSCCPGWIKYLEEKNPKYLHNISTCKSPMVGELCHKKRLADLWSTREQVSAGIEQAVNDRRPALINILV